MSAPLRKGSYNVLRKISSLLKTYVVISDRECKLIVNKIDKGFIKSRHFSCNNVYIKISQSNFSKSFAGNPNTIQNLHIKSTARNFSKLVLGIETSCDDTGAAIVDYGGNILGEYLHSQTKLHVQFGGILPPLARDLHQQHIAEVVDKAVMQSGLSLNDVDAIATSVKPGLPMSLTVGLEYSKKLVKQFNKPFIPIHHMEAHALTARMLEPIEVPFLVLLISGGHCLLSVVRDIDDFLLIGKSKDVAPGDVFDKVARRLKLKHIKEYYGLSGGRAMELAAQSGNPKLFELVNIMHHQQDCNFSFSGMKAHAYRLIEKEEAIHGVQGGDILPNIADICANIQYSILHHLAKRVQRAILFCDAHKLLSESKQTLVVSGGVASNMFIRRGLEKVCSKYDFRLVCPPPKLCTDNGIMIAWNGVEKLKKGRGLVDIDTVKVHHKSPLGEDWTERVAKEHIKLGSIKLLD